MLQDVNFALRLLNRSRGHAAVAIVTVALGVGANTAVFSIADSVLFRPLSFRSTRRGPKRSRISKNLVPGGEERTQTALRPRDLRSRTSASSATRRAAGFYD